MSATKKMGNELTNGIHEFIRISNGFGYRGNYPTAIKINNEVLSQILAESIGLYVRDMKDLRFMGIPLEIDTKTKRWTVQGYSPCFSLRLLVFKDEWSITQGSRGCYASEAAGTE